MINDEWFGVVSAIYHSSLIISSMHSDIRKLDRKFDLLNEDVMEVRSDQRDMNRRVDKLERKVS